MATPSLPGPEPDVREVPEGVGQWVRPDGFIHFGGRAFRQIGDGMFEFRSNTNPNHLYTVDILTEPYCDCWAMRRSPTVPCCHLRTIQGFLKRLKQQATT